MYGYFGEFVSWAFKIYWKDVLKESEHWLLADNRAKSNVDLKAILVDGKVRFFLNIEFNDCSSKEIYLDGGDGIDVDLCPDELRNVLTESKEVLMIKLNSTEAFDF